MRPPGGSKNGLRRGHRYLVGMGAIFVVFLGFLEFAPPEWRVSLWLALGLAMVVQVPLGAWLVGTVGTDRFLPIWVLGILMRLTVVAVAGLVLFPSFHLPAAPGLISLVLLLMASLALEGLVLLLEFRGIEA